MSIIPNIEADLNVSDIDYGFEIDCTLQDGEPLIYTGKEALKIWINKALSTARYIFPIYSTDFGTEIESLIGKSLPFTVLEKEVKRQITECLLVDKRIKEVSNFEIRQSNEKLEVIFKVLTFDNNNMEVATIV